MGSGIDPTSDIGPLVGSAQRDRLEALLAKPHGGRVLAGGKRPADRPRGYFFEPTLVSDVATDSALWREETFGPALAVTPYDDLDAAIDDANSLEAGLAAFAFMHDLGKAVRLDERLAFGMVAVNGWVPHATEGPFPGWKQSGMGVESGPEGLAEHQETKLVGLFL